MSCMSNGIVPFKGSNLLSASLLQITGNSQYAVFRAKRAHNYFRVEHKAIGEGRAVQLMRNFSAICLEAALRVGNIERYAHRSMDEEFERSRAEATE